MQTSYICISYDDTERAIEHRRDQVAGGFQKAFAYVDVIAVVAQRDADADGVFRADRVSCSCIRPVRSNWQGR